MKSMKKMAGRGEVKKAGAMKVCAMKACAMTA
jgi:hypothetical protein